MQRIITTAYEQWSSAMASFSVSHDHSDGPWTGFMCAVCLFVDICGGVAHWSHGSTRPETKHYWVFGSWSTMLGQALPGGGATGAFTVSPICEMTWIANMLF